MYTLPNSKILGAFIVGTALVALAYISTNFAAPSDRYLPSQAASPAAAVTQRTTIAVTDNDNNGIEDWRDNLITSEPVLITQTNTTDSTYTPPTTLTGQVGVSFFQNYVQSKTAGQLGTSQNDLINNAISKLERDTSFPIYDVPNVTVVTNYTDEDIVIYANAAGYALVSSQRQNRESEVLILRDIINRKDTSRISEIEIIAQEYRLIRETLVTLPVPQLFLKEHLDLLNTVMAVEKDVEALTKSFSDPAYTLLRLKRYQEDVEGLSIALQNMYTALLPYGGLFSATDSAMVFSTFKRNTIGI